MKLPPFSPNPGWWPRLTAAAAVLLFTLPLQAHPGHGLLDGGAAHLLASPYHLTAIILTGIGLLTGAQFVRQRMPRHALRVTGLVALAGAVIIWNFSV